MSQHGTKDSEAPEPAPLKPPNRRLVVMFDGTGNTRQNTTNVSRMFEAIDDSLPEFYKPIDGSEVKDFPPFKNPGQDPTFKKIVQCKMCNQSLMEPVKHDGDDSEVNFRAGVPCELCHRVVVEPAVEPEQKVKYIRGVGTTWKGKLGQLSAQALGYGLSGKIREGYTWLCSHYREGDEVFVFGFSRGAYAARSLVSLLHKCGGVLKKTPNSSTPDNLEFDENNKVDMKVIKTAYQYYRAHEESPDEPTEGKQNGVKPKEAELKEAKQNGVKRKETDLKEAKQNGVKSKLAELFTYYWDPKAAFEQILHDKWNESTEQEYTITLSPVQVKMLGVWDTVGALGIPESKFAIFNYLSMSRTQYKFHDQNLSCIVQNAYHALALDEEREAFEPTLWESRTLETQEVKQVWFVGSHSNVGGGADLDDTDDPDDLWQYSYVWMQRQAEKNGLRFLWRYESPATRQAKSDWRTRRVSLRKPEPSLEKFAWGAYNMYKKLTPMWSTTPYIRRTDPKKAMLHWSVVERIKVTEADRVEAVKKATATDKSTEPGTELYKPKPLFRNHCIHDFMATVIPEGSMEVIAPDAPDQMDAQGTLEGVAAKWHIETDDVMARTLWRLPLPTVEKGMDKKTGSKLE